MGNSVVHERGVSNHEGHRRISDVLDNTIWRGGYQSSSGTRALVHGLYHEHLASQKERAGNYEGAAAERARAQHSTRSWKDPISGKPWKCWKRLKSILGEASADGGISFEMAPH